MAEGVSLRSICLADDMPDKATVFRWLAAHKEFRDQYARAREARADAMAEEILEISDDDSDDAITDPESGATRLNTEFVARSRLKVDTRSSRLKVDTRKWLMARMAPKVYGDKVSQEVSGPDGGAIKHEITEIQLVAVPIPENLGEQ